jgi:hypothetical protein
MELKMRTIQTNLYQYSELSEAAKQKARDWYTGDGFDFYADTVIEDAMQVAELLGVSGCKVFYSGFGSQGDGACINGTYRYTKGAVKAIKGFCDDAVLIDIAKRLQAAQKMAFHKTRVEISHSGHYCHERSMDYSFSNEVLENTEKSDALIKECFIDFAVWIYKQLQNDYEYQTSDSAVAETIEANEYEFLESGKRA